MKADNEPAISLPVYFKSVISELYFTKNHDIGSLVVRKAKKIVRLTAES